MEQTYIEGSVWAMNKKTKIMTVLLFVILCIHALVLFNIYDKVNHAYADMVHADALLSEKVDVLTGKINAAASKNEAAAQEENSGNELVQVQVSGHFVATVRSVIPDYCYDNVTPMSAVVTCFQSTPFTIWLGEELASCVTVGETYIFEIEEKTIEIPRENMDRNLPSPEVSIPLYSFWIASVTVAGEDDYGLNSYHFTIG